ncbi:hypothetical protein WJX72_007548 [[Myrmecia] bisecta]|uniref:Protein-serine/threonine kinase n=1 Tax=[Myrmecia] bisecta TaxID=41462 RepID=A0AAW1QBP3_9CHLO
MLQLRLRPSALSSVQQHIHAGKRFYDSTVEKFVAQPTEALSLQQMLEFGRAALYDNTKILESARIVQRELPKRLARRLMDLQFLPYIVVTNPHIKRVYDAYYHTFDTIIQQPLVQTHTENEHFTVLLKRLVDEHAPMLDALAAGLRECSRKPFVGQKLHLDNFLDNMLHSRISRRVIAEQHINLANRRPGFIGVICTDLNIREAIDFAVQRTKQACTETYGVTTEVLLSGDISATIPYIPTHLDYMLHELLKNAMRAVVERHHGHMSLHKLLPPVHVRICAAAQDITLRVSDQGGGIADESLDEVWRYGYTTIADEPSVGASGAANSWAEMAGTTTPAGGRYRMGGLGFGLPLSRLYARYFGGDLQLVSMPGYGADAYLNLKRLEGEWQEHHVEEQSESLLSDAVGHYP